MLRSKTHKVHKGSKTQKTNQKKKAHHKHGHIYVSADTPKMSPKIPPKTKQNTRQKKHPLKQNETLVNKIKKMLCKSS